MKGRPLRVGLVIYGRLETLTGGYLYDRKLLEHLAARGETTEVVSLPERGYLRHLLDNFSPALARRLAGGGFDVLLQDELNHPSLWLLNRRLRRRARCPIVTLVHLLRSSEPRRAGTRRLTAAIERRYFATVDGAIYNSRATREAVHALAGRPVPGIVAYPGGDHLDAALDGALGGEPLAERAARGPLRVLSVANVVPGKGLDVLVEALLRLPPGGWRLTVAGSLTRDAAWAAELRRRIERAGVADAVELLGAVPGEGIPALLAASHVMAVPSRYEALGIAYLEAMRFGLPVVATAAGGAREVVSHGETGFLVAPGDVEALARHLRALAADRELLARLGAAARRRMESHPSWEESFERVRAYLRALPAASGEDTVEPVTDEETP